MMTLEGVSFAYGARAVLRDISCRVENGQITGLIGANGAGKSTLLRLCARLIRPQGGVIRVDGKPVLDYSPKPFARQLSFLPQHRPIPALTVQALVCMARYAHGSQNQQAVAQAIQTVGLNPEQDVRSLSGGQRQMAYLAMLLAQQSPHVLLDEPFTHLDIGAQLDAAQVLRGMKNDGKCVLVVMHDLNLLCEVCDRVILLHDGVVAFDGAPEACLQSPAFEQAFGVTAIQKPSITFQRGCFT